jgi:putative ABC transport system ATP-binding protein
MLAVAAFHYLYPAVKKQLPAEPLALPSFNAAAGDLIWLAGESGCGKTTLLNLIAGLLPTPVGNVHFLGQDLAAMSSGQRDAWRASHIGWVPQEPLLIDSLTAQENALLPGKLAGIGTASNIEALFETLNLKAIAHHRPAQLSRGQQQRVALARAFSLQPALVLADEPTANLDDRHAQDVMSLLKALIEKNNSCAIIASHDSRIAPYCTHKVVFA